MHLTYLFSRTVRHFMPDSLARAMLRRGWIIRAGIETRFPEQALERYIQALDEYKISPSGKSVLVFGYGGNFALGCGLLRAGASHVILCDRFAPPDEENNRKLLAQFGEYLTSTPQGVAPRPEWITLLHDDIIQVANQGGREPVDLVVSSSVYEHLDDVDGITRALARLTKPNGAHLHFVDLRDHYFKYPFEMLAYSDKTWNRYLNPTSNLNRYRLPGYQEVFDRYFRNVAISVVARDLEAFEKAKDRIRPEFLSQDPDVDAVTLIRVFATQLLPQSA